MIIRKNAIDPWNPKTNIDQQEATAARDRLARCLDWPLTWTDVGRGCIRLSANTNALFDLGADVVTKARAALGALATILKCGNEWQSVGQACLSMASIGGDDLLRKQYSANAGGADDGGVDLDALKALAPKVAKACGLPDSTSPLDAFAAAAGAFNAPSVPGPTDGDTAGTGDGDDIAAMSMNVEIGNDYGGGTATVKLTAREVEQCKRNRERNKRAARGFSLEHDLRAFAVMKMRDAMRSTQDRSSVTKFSRELAAKGVRILRTGG